MSHHKGSALIAAAQLSDSLAECLRYVQEGDAFAGIPFGEVDPLPKIAEAIIRLAEIELEYFSAKSPIFTDEVEQVGQLIAANRKFLNDWISG
jgi:hypothetical protein